MIRDDEGKWSSTPEQKRLLDLSMAQLVKLGHFTEHVVEVPDGARCLGTYSVGRGQNEHREPCARAKDHDGRHGAADRRYEFTEKGRRAWTKAAGDGAASRERR